MKHLALKNFLTLLVMVCLALIAFSLVQAGRHNSQGDAALQDRPDIVAAVRRGGLREAARIKRHYVASIRTSSWLKYDVESLVKNSEAVVTGTAGSGVGRLSSDGKLIFTDYEVKLAEVIKGDSAFRDTVSVGLQGGKVVFEDGSSAEILTPHLRRMESGKVYLLFLSRDKDTRQFMLTGGGQGLFELSGGSSGVKPHGHSSDVVQKYKGRDAGEFLEEVRDAARKYPNPSQCCK